MPDRPSVQVKEAAMRLCAAMGHDMTRWLNHRHASYAECRTCGRTVIVTRIGLRPLPPGDGSDGVGSAPFYPCIERDNQPGS